MKFVQTEINKFQFSHKMTGEKQKKAASNQLTMEIVYTWFGLGG